MLDKYEKELFKKQREQEKQDIRNSRVKKAENRISKKTATFIICGFISLLAIVLTMLFSKTVAKFSVITPKRHAEEVEEIYYHDDEENNIYYININTSYAYGIKGVVNSLDDYYGLQTQDTVGGIREELGGASYYLSKSSKGYEILNPSTENPEFYLIIRVNKQSEDYDFDAVFSVLYLKNKNTNEIISYQFDKPLKLYLK